MGLQDGSVTGGQPVTTYYHLCGLSRLTSHQNSYLLLPFPEIGSNFSLRKYILAGNFTL